MRTEDRRAKELYLEKLRMIKERGGFDPFETREAQRERIARAKKDVGFFVETYLGHYATAKSAKFQIKLANLLLKLKVLNILVRWGRGLAKSVWCDVIIPLWLWTNDDIGYMVVVGNNYDKAKILLSDLQAEFEANPKLIHDFGEQKMQGSWEDGYFRTKNGFIAKALGMGQSPRGLRLGARRPDYIACDDLEDKDTVKNPKRQKEIARWIEKDLIPTMDGPRRRFLMVNNHFHPVTIQEVLRERHPGWKLDRVDAYDPVTYKPTWETKYSATYYREIEEAVGVLAARAEYNNDPHIEGSVFTEDLIQWDKIPAINHYDSIVAHWDVAYSDSATADYNAVRVWGLKDNRFYLIDCYVRQSKMKGAVSWIAQFQKNVAKSAAIRWQYESQFWNDELDRTISEVEHEEGVSLRLRKVDLPRANKLDRIMSTHPIYQNGRVYYNEKLKGHSDTQIGLMQLYGIEPGYNTNDDAPDADERCFTELGAVARHNRTKNMNRAGNYRRNNARTA